MYNFILLSAKVDLSNGPKKRLEQFLKEEN